MAQKKKRKIYIEQQIMILRIVFSIIAWGGPLFFSWECITISMFHSFLIKSVVCSVRMRTIAIISTLIWKLCATYFFLRLKIQQEVGRKYERLFLLRPVESLELFLASTSLQKEKTGAKINKVFCVTRDRSIFYWGVGDDQKKSTSKSKKERHTVNCANRQAGGTFYTLSHGSQAKRAGQNLTGCCKFHITYRCWHLRCILMRRS